MERSTEEIPGNDEIDDSLSDVSTVDESNVQEVKFSELPDNVQESYRKYESNAWTGPHEDATPGTRGGLEWKNKDGDLPENDENGEPVTYKEYDVNDKEPGSNRDAERFVRDNNENVYYTNDHYESFRVIDDEEEQNE